MKGTDPSTHFDFDDDSIPSGVRDDEYHRYLSEIDEQAGDVPDFLLDVREMQDEMDRIRAERQIADEIAAFRDKLYSIITIASKGV